MTKAHRLQTRQPLAKKSGVPINFLLGCSEVSLDNYELARLADVANDRQQLLAVIDHMVDNMALAWLAAWFRTMDRNALRHAIENEESPTEWAARIIRERQRSSEEIDQSNREPLPPGVAHLAAALRYAERNMAEGLCSVCPEPLDRDSVRYCTKHLAAVRAKSARQRGTKGEPGSRDFLYGEIPESTHGRQPGTLASLAINREKATRALLLERGIQPEHAAVGFNAAVGALAKIMPRSKDSAMTQTELFQKAGIVTKTTGQRALADMLEAGAIERIGKGGMRDVYRYWRGETTEELPKMAANSQRYVTTRVYTRKAPSIHIPEKIRGRSVGS